MGLDMYAFAKREGEEMKIEIAYWRKHNALHGWMEDRYRERGGKETFNGVELPLSLEDLELLEAAVKERTLEPTLGFFFGPSEYAEEDWERCSRLDLEFIAKAREHIAQGFSIFYDSWW